MKIIIKESIIKITALAEIIIQCNKNYHLRNKHLREQTKKAFICILEDCTKNKLMVIGIDPTEKNVSIAIEAKRSWENLSNMTKALLLKNICSLPAYC